MYRSKLISLALAAASAAALAGSGAAGAQVPIERTDACPAVATPMPSPARSCSTTARFAELVIPPLNRDHGRPTSPTCSSARPAAT